MTSQLGGWYQSAWCQVGLANIVGFGLQFFWLQRERELQWVMMSLRMESAQCIQIICTSQVILKCSELAEFCVPWKVLCNVTACSEKSPIPLSCTEFLRAVTPGFLDSDWSLKRCNTEFFLHLLIELKKCHWVAAVSPFPLHRMCLQSFVASPLTPLSEHK